MKLREEGSEGKDYNYEGEGQGRATIKRRWRGKKATTLSHLS